LAWHNTDVFETALTIINLRGGNGSGKTTVHHWLIDEHNAEPMFDPPFFGGADKKANAWKIPGNDKPLYVIGKYTGGADSILFETLWTEIQGFAQHGHVFFENVLVSGGKMAWLKKRRTMPDQRWFWLTLDTPAEVCIERIYGRNGGKPINEEQIKNFNARVRMLSGWLHEEGEESYTIDHTKSIEQVHKFLELGGWDCATPHQF
jgi:predicted ABC-type ATPase